MRNEDNGTVTAERMSDPLERKAFNSVMRLRELMEENGISLHKLAIKMNVPPEQLTEWLKGGKYLTHYMYVKILDALGFEEGTPIQKMPANREYLPMLVDVTGMYHC